MKRAVLLGMVVTVGALSITAAGFQGASQGPASQARKVAEIEKVKDNL